MHAAPQYIAASISRYLGESRLPVEVEFAGTVDLLSLRSSKATIVMHQ
jgi:hypothetical protein